MSIFVDGKKIRDEILDELKEKFESISGAVLAVVWVGADPATATFVSQKEKMAARAGVELRVFRYESDITEEELSTVLSRLADDAEINGIIVQLPLPGHIDSQRIISLIPPEKDVDALTDEAKVLSPVAAAVKEIIERHDLDLSGKKIVVMGKGKLVGYPVAVWLAGEGLNVDVVDRNTENLPAHTKEADLIVCGIGKTGILTPDIVKPGVFIIDAGTSEQSGQLAGDAVPACADKAGLFTPVPGGVGPVVLAMLFKNLWNLSRLTRK